MPENSIGLDKKFYKGSKSTLCTGCGHDSITNHITSAYFLSGKSPRDIAKTSGIGCSSKTPPYFLGPSHGINFLHGRMAPMATGAKVVSKDLNFIGISGDGDSASIGLGGFAHLLRRNLPMVYLIYNNGVYGLTKGQFSATASEGSPSKVGSINPFQEVDLCAFALSMGATFIARSFSGDAKQVVPLIQAAIEHRGTAVIDIISPCITFNNHPGSTKSFTAVKEKRVNLQELGFIEAGEEIAVDYKEGEIQEVELHSGDFIYLKKLDSQQHDVSDKIASYKILEEAKNRGEILTGLIYINEQQASLIENLNLVDKELCNLNDSELRPKPVHLEEALSSFN